MKNIKKKIYFIYIYYIKMKQVGMYVLCIFLFILVLFLLIALMTYGNGNCNSNSVNKHDIDSFINNWFNATESRDPNKPFSFFANDSVLFATVSDKFRNTPEEILDYFKMFIALPNLKNSLVKKLITKIDNNTWGYYAFVNWSWDGQPVTTARMSFVIRVHNNNKLKISLLHSSVLPDTP